MDNGKLGNKLYDGDIQDLFLDASNKLFNAVSHTIGPNGKNTAIPTQNNYLSIINDGKTILENISSNDEATKLALNTLKESCFATNLKASDGTTSTVVLQHMLLKNILEYNKLNSNKIDSKLLVSIRDILLDKLNMFKKDISSDEDLEKVITVALGSNEYTDIVMKAFNGIPKNQKPTLVKVREQVETTCINIDGINLSPVEINPVVLKTISLASDEPLNVIVLDQEISRIDTAFAKLLEKISKSDKKTIMLYTDIKPSVMDQLLYNIQHGALNLVPVRLAMSTTNRDELISDLADYFRLAVIDELNPYQTHYMDSNIFGEGTGYIMDKDSIIVKNDNEEYDEKVRHLPAHSTAIQVGFITYSQQDEEYRRLEDAIGSAYNALNYGYVVGGGYTYYCLAQYLSDEFEIDNKDIINPIKDALGYIFNYLSEDSKMQFIDYIMENAFDSYKVAEQVILNSFTVVSQILSTECLLVPYIRNNVKGVIE